MGCPVGGSLKEGVANWALLVQGIETADVILTFDPPWRPAMIKPDLKALLGFSEVS
jgi:metal-sulfur cluster biosynthetic enzyme